MGKGIGLVTGEGRSTDGIAFVGGVGFLGNSLERVIALAELAAGVRSKALCKAVNMAGGTGVTVPTDELATGLLVSCGPGLVSVREALALARELDEMTELPALLKRYFLDRTKAPRPLGIFS